MEAEDIIRGLPTRRENMVKVIAQTTEEATIEGTRGEMAMTSKNTTTSQKDTGVKTDSLETTMEITSKYLLFIMTH
jgi:hypothetical protein